jgi:hypothetical protein
MGPAADDLASAPRLVLPIAAVGAAGATFATFAVGGSYGAAAATAPTDAAIAGALTGALAGVLLDRWRGIATHRLGATLLRVVPVIAMAGVMVGAFVAWRALDTMHVWLFAPGGALVALLFVPSCLVVMRASARAGRARLGSLVANADRRSVWTTTATVIAVSAIGGMLAAPLRAHAATSLVRSTLCMAALLAIACAWRDGAARRRLARVPTHLDEETSVEGARAGVLDLGLGQSFWSAPPTAERYRSSSRGEVLLRGDRELALAALAAMQRRRFVALGVIGLIATAALIASL